MTVQGVYAQDVETWKRELVEAGWTMVTLHAWKAPDDTMHLGIYSAWCNMLAKKAQLGADSA